jgi:hypothetical protein
LIRIAITAEAYEAVARTLALGAVVVELQPNENGERWILGGERLGPSSIAPSPNRAMVSTAWIGVMSRHVGMRSLLPRPP